MILQVKSLTKTIKNKTILENISFDISNNEIISIIGHSGAGKTTLLHCLNGLSTFDKGMIIYDYLTIDSETKLTQQTLDLLHHEISLVFQNYNLYPHLNVLENLTIAPLLKSNKNKDSIIQEAKKWLQLLQISDKEEHYPFQLSGGEKQRVAIARACMIKPKIICFDEPTSALDPKLVTEVGNIFKNLKDNGLTILIITHDISFANMVSNRIITMEQGRLVSDIRNNPVI